MRRCGGSMMNDVNMCACAHSQQYINYVALHSFVVRSMCGQLRIGNGLSRILSFGHRMVERKSVEPYREFRKHIQPTRSIPIQSNPGYAADRIPQSHKFSRKKSYSSSSTHICPLISHRQFRISLTMSWHKHRLMRSYFQYVHTVTTITSHHTGLHVWLINWRLTSTNPIATSADRRFFCLLAQCCFVSVRSSVPMRWSLGGRIAFVIALLC